MLPIPWGFYILLTLGFYFSGLFVTLTPIPLAMALVQWGQKALSRVFLPCLLFVGGLYLFGLPHFDGFLKSSFFSHLIFIPGHNLASLWGIQAASFFGVGHFIFFFALGWALPSFLQSSRTYIYTALFIFITFLVLMVIYSFYVLQTGHSFFSPFEAYVGAAFESIVTAQREAQASLEQIELIEAYRPHLWVVARLFPSLVFCLLSFTVVLNLVLASKVFMKLKVSPLTDLTLFELPFAFVWAFLGVGFVCLAYFYGLHLGWILTLSLNLGLVLLFLFHLQGLSITGFFLKKKGLGALGFTLFFILLFLMTQVMGFIFLASLGLVDAWKGFRVKRVNGG